MKYVKIILSMLLVVSVFFGNIGSTLAQENELKNGEYTINFSFLYKGAPSNHMDNYIVKPATLFVKNGNKDIQLTLKNASVIAGFTVNGKEPEVVSNDGENRVIKFSVSDLSKMEDVLISVKAGAYESKYEMQMQFDTASITAVNVPKEEKPEVEKPNEETEQPKEDKPIVTGPSDKVVKLADGEYTANFNTINTDSAEASSMASYFENPATVKVKNGKQYVYLKIVKGSSMIPYLEIEKSGAFTKMEEVSTDGDTRIVRFEAENVGKVMKANVYVSAGAYKKTYDFRFVFDTTSIQAVKQDTTEEKPSGEKPSEEKPSGEVKEEENTLPGLKNGVYSLPFVFLVNGKETDKMDNNIQNPAQLTVKDGKNYVSITLKGTNTLTGFKVEKNKKFVEPTVLSSTNNSKVVQFEVADLEKLLNVQVKIDIAEINYHHEYTLQMKFDTANLLSGSKDKTENDSKEESGTGTVKDNDTNAGNTTNNTQVEEDNNDKTPEFDRESESEKEKDPSTTSSDKEKNSQTFDNAQLGMYLALLVGSLLGLVRRYRTRLLQ
ncbi:NEAT domain-containing protein [Viridibacillus arvi]|uniref:NEAT domain-containing protein n=1 Tax=Viridibacillus arvi TaxID=263475 RepID=UPI003D035A56